MKSGILRLHRCPYCHRGEGDIGIDVEAAANWQPLPAPKGETSINDFPEQPVIIFRPDRAVQEPCPHLIYVLVDVDVQVGAKHKWSRSFTWLRPCDPQHSALWSFWEEVVPRLYRPSIPYRYKTQARERKLQLAGREYRVTCKGHVICSVDPEGFCKELQRRDAVSCRDVK